MLLIPVTDCRIVFGLTAVLPRKMFIYFRYPRWPSD